jgi:hypothetical protein
MNEEMKKNLLNIEAFQRLALMVLFFLVFAVVELVIYAIALFQIVYLLFTGNPHEELKRFATALSTYVFDITKFLTFSSEVLPFPFQPWPADDKEAVSKEPKKEEVTSKPDDEEDEIHA